eukprot:8440633-Alexandrium_andersonii.AAC.1
MFANTAIRLQLQSALQNMQHRFRHSELELRGPRNGLKISPRSSRRVRSAPRFVQFPNSRTQAGVEGVRGRESAPSRPPIRNPPVRNPCNPWLLARESPCTRR